MRTWRIHGTSALPLLAPTPVLRNEPRGRMYVMAKVRALTELEGAILDRVEVNWRVGIVRMTFLPSKHVAQAYALRAHGVRRLALSHAESAEVIAIQRPETDDGACKIVIELARAGLVTLVAAGIELDVI